MRKKQSNENSVFEVRNGDYWGGGCGHMESHMGASKKQHSSVGPGYMGVCIIVIIRCAHEYNIMDTILPIWCISYKMHCALTKANRLAY